MQQQRTSDVIYTTNTQQTDQLSSDILCVHIMADVANIHQWVYSVKPKHERPIARVEPNTWFTRGFLIVEILHITETHTPQPFNDSYIYVTNTTSNIDIGQ